MTETGTVQTEQKEGGPITSPQVRLGAATEHHPSEAERIARAQIEAEAASLENEIDALPANINKRALKEKLHSIVASALRSVNSGSVNVSQILDTLKSDFHHSEEAAEDEALDDAHDRYEIISAQQEQQARISSLGRDHWDFNQRQDRIDFGVAWTGLSAHNPIVIAMAQDGDPANPNHVESVVRAQSAFAAMGAGDRAAIGRAHTKNEFEGRSLWHRLHERYSGNRHANALLDESEDLAKKGNSETVRAMRNLDASGNIDAYATAMAPIFEQQKTRTAKGIAGGCSPAIARQLVASEMSFEQDIATFQARGRQLQANAYSGNSAEVGLHMRAAGVATGTIDQDAIVRGIVASHNNNPNLKPYTAAQVDELRHTIAQKVSSGHLQPIAPNMRDLVSQAMNHGYEAMRTGNKAEAMRWANETVNRLQAGGYSAAQVNAARSILTEGVNFADKKRNSLEAWGAWATGHGDVIDKVMADPDVRAEIQNLTFQDINNTAAGHPTKLAENYINNYASRQVNQALGRRLSGDTLIHQELVNQASGVQSRLSPQAAAMFVHGGKLDDNAARAMFQKYHIDTNDVGHVTLDGVKLDTSGNGTLNAEELAAVLNRIAAKEHPQPAAAPAANNVAHNISAEVRGAISHTLPGLKSIHWAPELAANGNQPDVNKIQAELTAHLTELGLSREDIDAIRSGRATNGQMANAIQHLEHYEEVHHHHGGAPSTPRAAAPAPAHRATSGH